MSNRTSDDAVRRIWYARPGSLIEATDGYLEALRMEVRRWLTEIDAELARRRGAGRAANADGSRIEAR